MIDEARILEEAEAWAWAPPGSERIEGDGYLLLISDESWYEPQVSWSHLPTERVDAPVREVMDTVRQRGKDRLHWWVRASTDPPDMGAQLERLGFREVEEVEILSWNLVRSPDAISRPGGVHAEPVEDEAGVRTVHEVGARGFGSPPVTEEAMQRYIEEFRAGRASGCPADISYLVWIGDEPVGTGGFSVVGDVARLWGASVLPEFRGRGAYRALVAARLLGARAMGARLGLTKARMGTSGPILRSLGFRSHGSERCYEISLDT